MPKKRNYKQIYDSLKQEYPPYPKIDPLQDRRRKLTDEQREEIRSLYRHGYTVKKIAKMFGVCWHTAYTYINPKYRFNKNRVNMICKKNQLRRDPEVYKRDLICKRESAKRRMKDPVYLKYFKEATSLYKKRRYYSEKITQK